MLIHDRFVFIHLPKTAGSFLATNLRREMPDGSLVSGVRNRKHPGWDDIPAQARGRPVLVFVRNPWDWYVSWYHFLLKRAPDPQVRADAGIGDFASTIRRACSGLIDPDSHEAPPPGEDIYTTRFRRFCGAGLDSEMLTFGRFESLVDDLDRFLTAAGAPLSAEAVTRIRESEPHNVTVHDPYPRYYDDELRDLVGECCQMIVRRFDYTF
jgi:hypothetical protein